MHFSSLLRRSLLLSATAGVSRLKKSSSEVVAFVVVSRKTDFVRARLSTKCEICMVERETRQRNDDADAPPSASRHKERALRARRQFSFVSSSSLLILRPTFSFNCRPVWTMTKRRSGSPSVDRRVKRRRTEDSSSDSAESSEVL